MYLQQMAVLVCCLVMEKLVHFCVQEHIFVISDLSFMTLSFCKMMFWSQEQRSAKDYVKILSCTPGISVFSCALSKLPHPYIFTCD